VQTQGRSALGWNEQNTNLKHKQHVRRTAPILRGSRNDTTKDTGANTRDTRRCSGGAIALGVDGNGKSSEKEENL